MLGRPLKDISLSVPKFLSVREAVLVSDTFTSIAMVGHDFIASIEFRFQILVVVVVVVVATVLRLL